MVSTDGLDEQRLTLIEFRTGEAKAAYFGLISSLIVRIRSRYRKRMFVRSVYQTFENYGANGECKGMKEAFVREAAA